MTANPNEALCEGGGPTLHHHWVPKREGTFGGEPSFAMRCESCDQPYDPYAGQNGNARDPEERKTP